jgi:alanine dehydrogenase
MESDYYQLAGADLVSEMTQPFGGEDQGVKIKLPQELSAAS